MQNNKFRPSGTMCTNCKNFSKDCSWLPFSTMKVIKVDKDGTKVVFCGVYMKKEKV